MGLPPSSLTSSVEALSVSINHLPSPQLSLTSEATIVDKGPVEDDPRSGLNSRQGDTRNKPFAKGGFRLDSAKAEPKVDTEPTEIVEVKARPKLNIVGDGKPLPKPKKEDDFFADVPVSRPKGPARPDITKSRVGPLQMADTRKPAEKNFFDDDVDLPVSL